MLGMELRFSKSSLTWSKALRLSVSKATTRLVGDDDDDDELFLWYG